LNWKDLCAYVHTGTNQISHWIESHKIEAAYPFEEISDVLEFSNDLCLLSSTAVAELMGNSTLALSIISWGDRPHDQ
jgi:hypothetical protein